MNLVVSNNSVINGLCYSIKSRNVLVKRGLRILKKINAFCEKTSPTYFQPNWDVLKFDAIRR